MCAEAFAGNLVLYQELCRVDEPETGATLMGYDGAGNLAWSASGLPPATACSSTGDASPIVDRRALRTYDARNRIATLAFPDANGNQSWTYTPDGLPKTVTTWNDAGASSVVNTYAYNKRRLLTGESQASGSNTWSVGYGYNANGHLATLVYPDSLTVAYAPNALGQPTQAGSYATGVTYWPNGAIQQFTYGNGIVHSLTQNARGLPDRSRDFDGSAPVHDDSYIYDGVGNVAAIADGVGPDPDFRGDRTMTYDGLNRLTQVTGDNGPSPMFGTASYTYDVADNLRRVTVTGGSQPRDQTYFYDPHNRLINITADGWAEIGLDYDEQGNLANKNGTLYAFDYGNRLRSGGPETYRYDVQGRRIRSSSSAGLVYSLYAQSGQLLFQRDERAGKRRQYVYLGGSLVAESSVPLAGGAATVTYQHTDALGTPVAITNASRTVTERREYEPYGYQLTPTLQDGPNYTGHVADAATGLIYMQQRYYDPELGIFPSTDPVTALKGPFNRYWYANANPYKLVDPDGRVAQLIKDMDGNVTLQIKVKFVGPGASKPAIKAIERRIESLHTSGFKIDLVPVTGKAGADTNVMTLGNGYNTKDFPTAGEGVKPVGSYAYGGNEGYINAQAGNYVSAAAHDTLHFAGMQDHYRDLPGSAPGARKSEILFGYDQSDIMASRQGTSVGAASFQDVLDNWSTQVIGP